MFSGGVGSWAAAKRVAQAHGTADMTLLFANAKMEDEDLHRYLLDCAANIGAPLMCIADGRTPWQLFRDEGFIGNTRVDLCSRVLKRELLDRWRNLNCTPEDTICYVGIDWSESHRITRLQARALPWKCEAPMCDPPYMTKEQMLEWQASEGIKKSRLYELGFPHNNCGGFCVKAGQGQFIKLLETMPERFAYHEQQEQDLREHLGKDVAILRDRRGGTTKPMTLTQLRERYEAKDDQLDLFEFGGCGCAID
jgi:hypothetical protein